MFESNRRGNMAWLLAMIFALFVLFNAGALSALAGIVVLTFFLFAFGALTGSFSPLEWRNRMIDALPFSRPATTDAARSAMMHAAQRPDFDLANYRLADVGLVVEEPRADGLHLREARLVSMDDEAVRPYAVVHAPRQGYPRQTLLRFEIADAAGQLQFVCEVDHWMRPGENLLLPDYRLPLHNNDQLNRMGTWDLHIWVDSGLLAAHHFSVSPSMAERRRQFGLDGEAQVPVSLEQDAAPVALDDLLGQQRSRTSGQ
jgi:hypothetical protein